MLLRKSYLEEQLLLNEIHAKKVISESKKSSNPELYIPILEGIQRDVNSIIEELKIYEK